MVRLFVLFFMIPCVSFAGSLYDSMNQSAAGMKVQGARMKVVSQNIANAESTGTTEGSDPYRRKLITFRNVKDKKTGREMVVVERIKNDNKSPFKARFEPSHPAADADGYVLYPNVNNAIETVDMKEAQRSHQANLGALETSKRMINSTLDMLR